MKKILVCGCRNFDDTDLLNITLSNVLTELKDEKCEFVEGGAKGADSLAKKFAEEHGIPVKEFPADWKCYGRFAGPIRNKKMLEYGNTGNSMLVAFWDGKSKGTKNMINLAQRARLEIQIVNFSSNGGKCEATR